MIKTCTISGAEFEISARDQAFFKRLGVSEPTLCPQERVRRRMAIRNERNLYKCKSDMTGDTILSAFHPDGPYKVYTKDEWMSDKWSAFDYTQEINFDRRFFDQFHELYEKVPRAGLAIFTNYENSDYCNYVGDVKNSYLCFGSIFIEDCMYGNPYYSKNCVDCFLVRNSEIAYECIDSEKLYNCAFAQDSYECSDCFYGYDLRGCRNCFGCVGLRNKSYHVFNKKVEREEYEKFIGEFSFCDKERVADVMRKFEELKMSHPRRATVNVNCQNVTGNYIFNSKNCADCFQIMENEDCSYNIQTTTSKDCYDMNYTEENELCYEYLGNYRNNLACFSALSYGCHDIWYCDYMWNSKHCFGCIGLRNAEYCIFNKRYKKEEYEELKGRLIEMMKAKGEWGEFFPIKHSPFAYNETVAMDYFPLTKEEALARGYRWRDVDESEFKHSDFVPPEDISDVDDGICNEVLSCEVSGRNFRITSAELKFYRKMGLPVPRKHFNERHKARLAMRLPYELYDRKCGKCGGEVQTAYKEGGKEKVYCEECYLGEVM